LIVPEDVEDAFQVTFLRLLEDGKDIRSSRFGTWLYRVAFRVSQRIRERRDMHVSIEKVAEPLDDVEAFHRIELRETQTTLEEEIDRLPEKLRVPLVMFHLEEHTREDVAAALGCSIASIKHRLERARQLLRSRMLRRGIRMSATVALLRLACSSTQVVADELIQTTSTMAQSWWQGNPIDSRISTLSHVMNKEIATTMFHSTFAKTAASVIATTTIVLVAIAPFVQADGEATGQNELLVAAADGNEGTTVPVEIASERTVGGRDSERVNTIFGGLDTTRLLTQNDPFEKAGKQHRRAPKTEEQRAEAISLVHLKHTLASDLERTIGKVFKVQADERTNSLLVFGLVEEMATLQSIVKRLDVPSTEPKPGTGSGEEIQKQIQSLFKRVEALERALQSKK
jgi:RNA polymerase sigma factor (sigma-70 family)